MSDTRAFLLFHVSAYPKAELSDLFKALPKRRMPARTQAKSSSRWTGRMSASIWIF